MLAHPPSSSTVSDFAVLDARGTSPGKRRRRCGGWTPPGGPVVLRNGLAAAHLQGPRFIVHVLDHLLSPVRMLYQIRNWPDTTHGLAARRRSEGPEPAIRRTGDGGPEVAAAVLRRERVLGSRL